MITVSTTGRAPDKVLHSTQACPTSDSVALNKISSTLRMAETADRGTPLQT